LPFSLFKARCPVDALTQSWIEFHMQWLVEMFGHERLFKGQPIVVTDLQIPIDTTLKKRSLADDVKQVADRLGMPIGDEIFKRVNKGADITKLGAIDPAQHQLLSRRSIWESHSKYCKNLVVLASTIFLDRYVDVARPEQWYGIAELTGVLLGGGVILANYTLESDHRQVAEHEFRAGSTKHGSMSAIELGYALALFADARGESQPTWSQHLCLDAKRSMTNGLRYIHDHGERYFNRRSIFERRIETDRSRDVSLDHKSDCDSLIALQYHWDYSALSQQQRESLASFIKHPNRHLQRLATEIAGYDRQLVLQLEDELLDLAYSIDKKVRVAALKALSVIELTDESMLALAANLTADSREIVDVTTSIVSEKKEHANLLIPHLTEAMRFWMAKCDFTLVHKISHAMVSIDDNAEAWLFERFSEGDPDFLHLALESYQIARSEQLEWYSSAGGN
jgi:hypothetical protein